MEGSSGETDVDGMWERDFSDLVSAIKDSYLEEPRTRHIEEGVLPIGMRCQGHPCFGSCCSRYSHSLTCRWCSRYHIGNLLSKIYAACGAGGERVQKGSPTDVVIRIST